VNLRGVTIDLREAAFALLVTGAAMTPWPWLALIVAGAYFAVLAFVADRTTPTTGTEGEP
jgi:hypothetical protein